MAEYKLGQTGSELQSIIDHVENFDSAPTLGSQKAVTSAGIKAALDAKANQSTTYTKEEINNLLNPFGAEIVWVAAADWPLATGESNTLYCVQGSSSFTCYGWTGTEFQELATYNWIVDAVPTKGSMNAVSSDGVYNAVKKVADDVAVALDVVDKVQNVNVFDKSAITSGGYVKRTDGTIYSSGLYFTTDYIPIDSAGLFANLGLSGGTYMGYAAYDSAKVFTHGGGNKQATFVSGDAYVRFSGLLADIDLYMVVRGTSADVPTEYVPFGYHGELKERVVKSGDIDDDAVTTETMADESVTMEKIAFKETKHGKNLVDVATIKGGYYNSLGEYKKQNTSVYNCSELIDVEPNESYHLSMRGNVSVAYGVGTVFMCFYFNGVFVSNLPSNTKQFTVPSNANQFAFTIQLAQIPSGYESTFGELQLEKGTERTNYEAYWQKEVIDQDVLPPTVIADESVTTDKIADGAVTQDKLGAVTIPASPAPFNGWKVGGTATPGNSVVLDKLFRCRKAFQTSAVIKGAFDSITYNIGSVYFSVDASKLTIGANTYPHGLTLGDITTIVVNMGETVDVSSNTSIRIIDDSGHTWEKANCDLRLFHGYVSIQNGNATGDIDVLLSAFNKDLTKKIWMFGDSYFSYVDSARWVRQIMLWGYDNYLLAAQGGKTASDLWNDLNILLESGARPTYIVWCLGMNGGTDVDGNVNPTWMGVTNDLIALCQSIGATLVFGTIPSIPNASHVALNNWIRNSGYRYIDFADAVENPLQGGSNYWRLWGNDASTPDAGSLLSSDKVHPTQYGAIELASRVLVDFPEITTLQ